MNGRQHLLKDDEGLERKTKCLLRENWSRLSVCQMPVFCSYACLSSQEAKWEICLGWYRSDARKLEEWASAQSGTGIAEFASREGDVENILKNIADRAAGKGTFHYSRFFAIGLFRLLECANASDPATLEQVVHMLHLLLLAPVHLSGSSQTFSTNPHVAVSPVCLESLWLQGECTRRMGEPSGFVVQQTLVCSTTVPTDLDVHCSCMLLKCSKKG